LGEEKRASVVVYSVQNDSLFYVFFCFTNRAEHHEILAEYKKGVGNFIGKILNYLYVLCDVLVWGLEVLLTC
jgi:hypothetical protein